METGAKTVKSRVNRIAGQVKAIQRMVDEGEYCVDVLVQIAAVRSALHALGVELLTNHVECCMLGHGSGSEHKRAKPMSQAELVKELSTALGRFLK